MVRVRGSQGRDPSVCRVQIKGSLLYTVVYTHDRYSLRVISEPWVPNDPRPVQSWTRTVSGFRVGESPFRPGVVFGITNVCVGKSLSHTPGQIAVSRVRGRLPVGTVVRRRPSRRNRKYQLRKTCSWWRQGGYEWQGSVYSRVVVELEDVRVGPWRGLR